MQGSSIICDLVIKEAKKLPKLGLTTNPSTYVLVQAGSSDRTIVTGICAHSCNPFWQYYCTLAAESALQKITFYVYNSNPNYLDQLIAVGCLEAEELMTRCLTTSQVPLSDAAGNFLRSFLVIEHCNKSPTNELPEVQKYTDRTAIKIDLLRTSAINQQSRAWLAAFPSTYLSIEYAEGVSQFEQYREVSESHPEATLRFCSAAPVMAVDLVLSQALTLRGEVLIANICSDSCMRIKYHHQSYEVVAVFSMSIIPNGFLPDKYSCLTFEISQLDIIYPSDRKVGKHWAFIVYGILGVQVFRAQDKGPKRIHVQDNTTLHVEYLEGAEEDKAEGWDRESYLRGLQPTNSFNISINSVSWSESMEAWEEVKMLNSAKGVTTGVKIRMCLLPASEHGPDMAPVLEKPAIAYYPGEEGVRVHTLKMSGACFSEIFPQKTQFKFMMVLDSGQMTMFPTFGIKNLTEYSLASTAKVAGNCAATLYLLTFDHHFNPDSEDREAEGRQGPDRLDNHTILKVLGDSVSALGEGRIVFNEKFLAYAKRVSLTKVCKRYSQMMKDKTLKVGVGTKLSPRFRESGGMLVIHNCILEGLKNRVAVTMIFGANELSFEGETGRYLMYKPYTIHLKDNAVQIKLKYADSEKTLHSDFEDLLGSPEPNTMYKVSFPAGNKDQLSLVYSFTASNKPARRLGLDIHKCALFDEGTPIMMQLRCLTISHENCGSFVVRMTKGSTIYESLAQNTVSNYIRFRDCEQILFGKQSFASPYIFVSVYCINSEANLCIYHGHIDSRTLLGRGTYELEVSTQMGEQSSRRKGLLVLQVLNNRIEEGGKNIAGARLSVEKVTWSDKALLKPFMKYYLAVECEGQNVAMLEVKTKKQDALIIEDSVKVCAGKNITWKLYSSLKAIQKEEFWASSEKELVGSVKQQWFQLMQEDSEGRDKRQVELRYLPSRDLKTKFTANKLALLENTMKLSLCYSKQNIEEAISVESLKKKPRFFEIDVLHSCAASLTITDIMPHFSPAKVLQFHLEPMNFSFCAFSRLHLNKEFILPLMNMELRTSLSRSSKDREKYKKEVCENRVKLRGKQLKTGEKFGVNINYEGLCLLKADVVVMHSKFTSYPRGKLSLTKFSSKSGVKEVEVHLLASRYETSGGATSQQQEPFRFHMAGKKAITLTRQQSKQLVTRQMSSCLSVVAVMENRERVRACIELARIQQFTGEHTFEHEWTVDGLWFNLEGEYWPEIGKGMEMKKCRYDLQDSTGEENQFVQGNQLIVQYESRRDIEMLQRGAQREIVLPDRKRGFRFIIQIPRQLHSDFKVKKVGFKDCQGQAIEVTKKLSDSSPSQDYFCFTKKSAKQFKIEQLWLEQVSEDFAQSHPIAIEELEAKNFTRRFLINRNPKLITSLIVQPYAIAALQHRQSLTFSFSLHRMLSSKGLNRKILWMENNEHDKILTRKFGLLLRHGEQRQLIRPIDENGRLTVPEAKGKEGEFKQGGETVEFGFDEEIDELEVVLYIESVLNNDLNGELLEQAFEKDWMTMLPVAYGQVSLDKMGGSTGLVACKMNKYENSNETIDHALNEVIMRPEGLYCLGALHFEKKKWGLIYISLEEMSAVCLESSNSQTDMIFIQMGVENNTTKEILAEVSTEARKATQDRPLSFSHNQLDFMFMESKVGCMYGLKIVANVISVGQKYRLFEKRVDLTEYLTGSLSNSSQQAILTQLKASECTGASKSIQINLKLENLASRKKPIDYIEEGKRINRVDIVRFQESDEGAMVGKLLGCQHASHLHQISAEVKESVLYSDEPQYEVIELAGHYLSFQSDAKLAAIAIEMLSLSLHKHGGKMVAKLGEHWIGRVHEHLLALASCKELPISSQPPRKLGALEYEDVMQKLGSSKEEAVRVQKAQIYEASLLFAASSAGLGEEILNLVIQLTELSPEFKEALLATAAAWNESYLYRSDAIYSKYLYFLQLCGTLQEQVATQVLEAGLERDVSAMTLVRVWAGLPTQKTRAHYAKQLVMIYGSKLAHPHHSTQIIQAFRAVLNYLAMYKIDLPAPESWSPAFDTCMSQLETVDNIVLLNNYGELLVKLIHCKYLKDVEKESIVSAVRKRQEKTHDKAMKAFLNSLMVKICGKDPLSKGGKGQNTSNNVFYKKYLITS